MNIVGFDIGATGAVATIFDRGGYMVEDMDVIDGKIDSVWLSWFIREHENDIFYVEKLQSTPKASKVVCFKMGLNYGIVRGALAAAGVRFVEVSPASWKKAMKVRADKEHARSEAIRIFPDLYEDLKRKKDHNRAEALLIAEYGRRQEVLIHGIK